MSNIPQINNRLGEKDEKQRIHEHKLQLIKDEISRKPTPVEVKQSEQYHKRMEELMKYDGDPIAYCFESGSVHRNEESSLILTILNDCDLHSEVTKKRNSDTGRFREREALLIMDRLLDYLVDEHIANKKPFP